MGAPTPSNKAGAARGEPSAPAGAAASAAAGADLRALMHELGAVAEYITRMKREIGALRAHEITRDRLPMAHDELGSVVTDTAAATNAIMAAAEGILALPDGGGAAYREGVEARVYEIFEACAFQDITGQRIAKVVDALGQLETRLARFADAVNAHDGVEHRDDAREAKRERAERLILNGPQMNGPATPQDAIDALFA